MTNASPMTDVGLSWQAGRGSGRQVAAVCHKPQVARKTEARNTHTHTHTHIRRQLQFTFMFMANIVVVVVFVAGTTNCIWLCAWLILQPPIFDSSHKLQQCQGRQRITPDNGSMNISTICIRGQGCANCRNLFGFDYE